MITQNKSENNNNLYQFGVLIGNHVEERFSLDLINKEEKKINLKSTTKSDYNHKNNDLNSNFLQNNISKKEYFNEDDKNLYTINDYRNHINNKDKSNNELSKNVSIKKK